MTHLASAVGSQLLRQLHQTSIKFVHDRSIALCRVKRAPLPRTLCVWKRSPSLTRLMLFDGDRAGAEGCAQAAVDALPKHVLDILNKAKHSWLRNTEIAELLRGYQRFGFQVSAQAPFRPPSQSHHCNAHSMPTSDCSTTSKSFRRVTGLHLACVIFRR